MDGVPHSRGFSTERREEGGGWGGFAEEGKGGRGGWGWFGWVGREGWGSGGGVFFWYFQSGTQYHLSGNVIQRHYYRSIQKPRSRFPSKSRIEGHPAWSAPPPSAGSGPPPCASPRGPSWASDLSQAEQISQSELPGLSVITWKRTQQPNDWPVVSFQRSRG